MPVAEPTRYGIAELSEDTKKVLRCVEKPKEPKSNLAVIGVYAFNHKFFEVYPKLRPSWRNEMEIMDAISVLIDSGFKVVPHRVEGWGRTRGSRRMCSWRTSWFGMWSRRVMGGEMTASAIGTTMRIVQIARNKRRD
jgi:dTDP-glucose pyrophosphorylase